MYRYIMKRIFWLIPILVGASFIVFTIMYLSPGDAAEAILGESATEEELTKLRIEMGLNQPFIIQYFKYAFNVFFRFDFGRSYISNRVVITEITSRLPNTFKLAFLSTLVATIIGIPLGVISAKKPNSIVDNTSMTFSLFGISIPIFWQSMILILVFSVTLRWLPATGFDSLEKMILPIIALSTSSMGTIARITRSSMLDTLEQDYIRTAKAKGLSNKRITYLHAFKNAMIPVVTIIGLQFGSLLGGAVITESIFSINGIGLLMVNSIKAKDIMMVQSGVLFIAFVFTFMNLLVDILYAYIDPRICLRYK